MFDSFHHHTQRGDQHVTITEKRAPTDESVRLLREMEKAAQDKIVQSLRLQNCPVDAVIHKYENNHTHQTEFLIHAVVHGQKVEARKTIDYGDALGTMQLAEALVQVLAEQIAIKILGPAFNKLQSQLRPRHG